MWLQSFDLLLPRLEGILQACNPDVSPDQVLHILGRIPSVLEHVGEVCDLVFDLLEALHLLKRQEGADESGWLEDGALCELYSAFDEPDVLIFQTKEQCVRSLRVREMRYR